MRSVSNVVVGTFTFENWIDKTNEIAALFGSDVVTANATLGISTGNAYVNGIFSANVLAVTQTLRGGNNSSNAILSISTDGFSQGPAVYVTNTASTSNTNANQLVDSFPIATYRSAEYLIQVKASTNSYQTSKILLTHDGSTPILTEYAVLTTNGSLGVFTAAANSTAVALNWSPTVATTNVFISRTSMAI